MATVAALACTLMVIESAPVHAQATTGTINAVLTDTNLVAIAGADVRLLPIGVRLVTAEDGGFRISRLPYGQYEMRIQKLGFRSVTFTVDVASDTFLLAVQLEPRNPMLDAMVVIGLSRSLRMSQFDKRRAQGLGQFITAADIEKRNTPFATELVRTFQGVNVKTYPGAGGAMQYFAVSTRSGTRDDYRMATRYDGQVQSIKGCPLLVYIDGVAMPTPYSLDQLPSPKDLEGIEVYSGPATTPPQFGGVERRCGVMLVWTKEGG